MKNLVGNAYFEIELAVIEIISDHFLNNQTIFVKNLATNATCDVKTY